MKFTEKYLKRIIKEEAGKVLHEVAWLGPALRGLGQAAVAAAKSPAGREAIAQGAAAVGEKAYERHKERKMERELSDLSSEAINQLPPNVQGVARSLINIRELNELAAVFDLVLSTDVAPNIPLDTRAEVLGMVLGGDTDLARRVLDSSVRYDADKQEEFEEEPEAEAEEEFEEEPEVEAEEEFEEEPEPEEEEKRGKKKKDNVAGVRDWLGLADTTDALRTVTGRQLPKRKP